MYEKESTEKTLKIKILRKRMKMKNNNTNVLTHNSPVEGVFI